MRHFIEVISTVKYFKLFKKYMKFSFQLLIQIIYNK